MTTIIYLITNHAIIPKKQYVGKTQRSLEKRFKEHVRMGRSGRNILLGEDLQKYGTISFSIEELERVEDYEALKREGYYIKKIKTHKNEGGYNQVYEDKEYQDKTYFGYREQAMKNLKNGRNWRYGIPVPQEEIDKVLETKRYRKLLGKYNNYGHKQSEKTKCLLSKQAKERHKNGLYLNSHEKLREASSNRVCIYNVELMIRKFVKKDEIDKYLQHNWITGRGQVWIYQNEKVEMINIWELKERLEDGWVSGRKNC